MKRHIPNFITSLNLASGFVAILYAATGELVTASWLILAAMIFDFFDGFSARLLNAYSETGKELDSLADVVSFGVAPAVIIYMLLGNGTGLIDRGIHDSGSLKRVLILISPALMPVCAALRLAIFNIDETQKTSFKGLPTPANALAVISVVIAGHYSDLSIITSFTDSKLLLLIFTVILSLLMVSRIPLLSLKTKHLRFKGNEGRYILVSMVVLTLVMLGTGAAPLIIPIYITASLISMLFKPV
ncbi:MAG: CDP-diacylglycerol---serine O-phosphatidyltransferase [Bacteroidota bacterium]|nr:CDP-diacylglycerol---serine O-phosphatidyltransferase [Bacteroidota bacterium]